MSKKSRSKLAEWQLEGLEGGVCSRCGVEAPKLTVDHIIPGHIIKDLDPTGELVFEWDINFQLICLACNHNKGGNLDRSNPMTFTLLSMLLHKVAPTKETE